MRSEYIDEALLKTVGQSELTDLYDYIHELESKPIVDEIANQIIVGQQYLQDQVKDNDNKLIVKLTSQEPTTPSIPVAAEITAITLIRLTLLSLLYKINDIRIKFSKLRNIVVYNIGLYISNDFMGFVFTNLLEELWPFSKHAFVLRDNLDHKQNVMSYIDSQGFNISLSIGSIEQITLIKGNTHIAIAGIYYTDQESFKRAIRDVNSDVKINIVHDWYVSSTNEGVSSMSYVQDVVQILIEMIGDEVQPHVPTIPVSLSNCIKINTKLVNSVTLGLLKIVHLVKEEPI
ncbi:MAG: hypothetical protein EZS28_037965 [Streblomastix strix]|uniref:Uncharacterized protein n=1 Tax=Streblomastix strix TaxID=222440 RepID=A0A5J4U846_9EUKA|nr:MAG: hypothetical protein EZS28_037965 [Streblomastix strix]